MNGTTDLVSPSQRVRRVIEQAIADGELDGFMAAYLLEAFGGERRQDDLKVPLAELSDAFVPTKVRGQISPGGPMPSITLKGVSIKGQSKVAYAEAVAKAQSEAQSALSQEQVPRAYQGAVKDYFDDLKE